MQKKPTVSVVIPVYNEQDELKDHVVKLMNFLDQNLTDFLWSIIIADNASTDNTLTIAKQLSHTYPKISFLHLKQKGRGRAVKAAWQQCTSDIVAYMDVDLSTDLVHFPPLIRSLLRGYDLAIGTRNARNSHVYGRSTLRNLTSKGYILLIKLFFFVKFSDAQCGFKAVTRNVVNEVIPHIQDNGWFFDSELLIVAEKAGYRIYEEPVRWIDNPGSTVRVLKTAQGDLLGLKRLFLTRPWRNLMHV